MIILASTSDSLRLVTDKAVNLDVQTAWADLSGSTITPGRTNTLITTATTTTIVSSPGSSTYRSVKSIIIRNRSSLLESRVTVIHRANGSTDAQMVSVSLQGGDTYCYTEHDGWKYIRAPYGVMGSVGTRSWVTPTAGVLYTHVLTENISNAHVTANRLIDCRELQFPVVEDCRYWFCFNIMYTAAATGTGARFSIYGPGSTTALRYQLENSLTTTSKTNVEGNAAYDLPAASNATSAATGGNIAFVEGFVDTPTTNDFIYLRFASEVTVSAITILKGSCVSWQRVT